MPKDAWTQQENARIDQLRKGNAEVHVVDQFGNPVTNVTIDAREVAEPVPLRFGDQRQRSDESSVCGVLCRAILIGRRLEDEATWYFNEPTEGNVTYSVADGIASFAAANDITLRGPALFWGDPRYMQPWIKNLSNADLLSAMEDRLESAVTHFDGTFAQWTVFNETLHTHFFDGRLGSSILAEMYEQVRELDPDAQIVRERIQHDRRERYRGLQSSDQSLLGSRRADRRNRCPGALWQLDQCKRCRSEAQ